MSILRLISLVALTVILAIGACLALQAALGAATQVEASASSSNSFTMEKTPNVSAAAPGQQVTFVLTVSGVAPGTAVLPVVITETLPSQVTLMDATPGFSEVIAGLQWQRALSPVLGYDVVTFSVRLGNSLAAYTPIVNADYRAWIGNTTISGEPVTLTVELVPGVEISPSYLSRTVAVGERISLTYSLTNTGNFTDTFYITGSLASAQPITGWHTTWPSSLTIRHGESRPVAAIVDVGGAPGNVASATLNLTVTSQNGARDSVTALMIAHPSYIYLPLVLRAYPPLPVIASVTIAPVRGGTGYAYTTNVSVVVSATIGGGDVLQDVRFGNGAEKWGEWQPFTPTLSYTYSLPAGSGYKVLYVQVKGVEGGVAQSSAAITLLENGDFADGLVLWNPARRNLPVPTPDNGRILLGDPTLSCYPIPIGESTISQVVDLTAVPVGKTIALCLDYEIQTEDKFIGPDYDRLVVFVDDQEKHRDGYQGSAPFGCHKWHQVPRAGYCMDLSAYRGKKTNVLIGNYTRYDNWYNTYTFVDNVHVVVSP